MRRKNECLEGTTYETDIGLFNALDIPVPIADIDNELSSIIVFFDLETSGFSAKADILQIAAKYEKYEFCIYIKPTMKINEKASMVNGLRYIDGNLQLYGQILITSSLFDAMVSFYQFLYRFNRKCILTAHNCSFDYPRIMAAAKKMHMDNHFQSVVLGFADTIPLIKKCTQLKGKGNNKLKSLADKFGIEASQVHDAVHDVRILEKIVQKLEIVDKHIVESTLTWGEAIKKKDLSAKIKSLDILKNCTSIGIRRKMIISDITYDMIFQAYKEGGVKALSVLLGIDENGKIAVTKNAKCLNKIADYLKTKLTD